MRYARLGRPLICGHRGASSERPENTLAALQRARELGADMVEFDVQRAGDGAAVVIHDPTLDRTTSGRGRVAAHSLPELRQLDAGAWFGPEFAGLRLPTLAEALAAVPPPLWMCIEIKAPELAATVAEAVRAAGAVDRTVVSCFDHRVLARLRKIAAEIDVAVLQACRPLDFTAAARAVGAVAIHSHHEFIDAEAVGECRAHGLALAAWTVDEPGEMRRLIDLGVDAILTNDVARLAAVLRASSGQSNPGTEAAASAAPGERREGAPWRASHVSE